MSYDEGLAQRLRELLPSQQNITERKMFGGLAFMSRGYMFVGIVGDVLMARVGPEYYELALSRPYVREMDFTGKPMKGYVYVESSGYEEDSDLSEWVLKCLDFVHSLPSKKPK
ncbi:TfoX/Sxy family protein [Sulfurirhabdus autotrophica]|uniref:TfoX-like protein n=1 Tax=Sulfurirhabdus autotrophica TaxID=1706046 RepID=A0A4R3YC88_9PROT|nr:TfoX/Sxy family protein [Sulfurirhabdus autotrophica]TCV89616.1 TfoX-like protein [Sulfurirhabdus autotrophica]